MSAVPTIYRSTDVGAPVLSGTPGALAAILDAVLVDGYGSKAPLGWSRVFSDGHKRVFRNNSTGGATGYYIRFNDSATTYIDVSGYESMTDIDTGINPLAASVSRWTKSNAASSAARDWVIVGNDRSVYLFTLNGITNALGQTGYFFGDLTVFGVTDVWGFAYTSSALAAGAYNTPLFSTNLSSGSFVTARNHSGSQIGVEMKFREMPLSGQNHFGAQGGLPHPYATTNGTVLSKPILRQGTSYSEMRATLPGVWIAEHNNVHTPGEIYGDFEDLPVGTELLCMGASYGTATVLPQGLIDITNPWY